jgi:D-threo-aldose 1-dehydrogenase
MISGALRVLGRTNLRLPPVGFGGGSLGEIFERIEERDADATLAAAWDAGVRYFDTAPWYGRGLSELRFGRLLRQRPRGEFVLSTKVGRTFHRPRDPAAFRGEFWKGGLSFEHRFDYTYDGIIRSYEQSMMRLGLNSLDVLLIHDLDESVLGSADLVRQHFADLERSGWRALEMLRHYKEVSAIGAGINLMGLIPEFLRRFDIDCFLVAMPFTLLDQSALIEEFPMCAARGVTIIIGAPFASGILATGASVERPYYNYLPATAEVIAKVKKIEALCAVHGVPLKAAAYQFPLRNPLVTSVVAGAYTAQQAAENAKLVHIDIPGGFWADLESQGLVHTSAD